MRLDGQRVVVIGGSSGIGLATAQLARAEGAAVTIAGRSEVRLREAQRALGECDLGDGAIEIGVFANARDRAAFVDERTDGLCRRAAALQAPVPPAPSQ